MPARRVFFFAILIATWWLAPALHLRADQETQVTLILPGGYSGAEMQLSYYLTGPFGGYGSNALAKNGERTLSLKAVREGRRADNIRIVAYLPGCEFITLDIDLRGGGDEEHQLDCIPLEVTRLEGVVVPPAKIGRATRLYITYACMWCHSFFGIRDGMVSTFQLGTVVLNRQGKFSLAVPDFARDSTIARFDDAGTLQLTLRDEQSGNIVGRLEPKPGDVPWLGVKREYPAPVTFRFVAQ